MEDCPIARHKLPHGANGPMDLRRAIHRHRHQLLTDNATVLPANQAEPVKNTFAREMV